MKYQSWKKIIAGIGLVAVVGAPALTMAGDFGHGHKHGGKGRGMEMRFERLTDELELTEGQKAQIRADREAAHTERKALAQQERTLREQVRVAVSEGADQATLDQLAAQVGALEVTKMQQRKEKREQFLAILTDEQKAELAEMKQSRMEKRERHLEDRLERLEKRKAQVLES